jgi:hypothetical protein
MAVWALSRLQTNERFEQLKACHLPAEPDDAVAAEWRRLPA